MPPEIIAEILKLGFSGVVILVLAISLYRKDQQVDRLQEARVADQKERAADTLRAAEIIEKQTQAAQVREKAADERWRLTEVTADRVKGNGEELHRIGRRLDQLALRLNVGDAAE